MRSDETDKQTNQWRIQDFPEVGAPTLGVAPTYDFAKNYPKLHEIERIWAGGGKSKFLLCRSAAADRQMDRQV